MARVNTGVVPPFGWRFPRNYPAIDDKWIESDTFENLITGVTNYRIANQRKLGNPGADIESYICSTYPQQCNLSQPPVSDTFVEDNPEGANFRERVTQWSANRYARVGSIALVEQDEANRRAAICLTCPQNQEWRIGCPPCISATERTLVLLRQNQNAEPTTLGCALSGQDNATAVWMPESLLKHRVQYLDSLPDHCWMKTL